MSNSELTRLGIALFGVYHLIVGIPSLLSLALLRRVGFFFYRLKIATNPDPQFEYVLKPLGLYALFVSMLSLYQCFYLDLVSQKNFLIPCALLLIGRGACRLYYSSLFIKAFGTSKSRNRGNAYFTFLVAAIFLALYLNN